MGGKGLLTNTLPIALVYLRSPDGAKIKPKMLYASSKDGLRKSLSGVAVEIQGTDFDEVAYDTVLDRIRR